MKLFRLLPAENLPKRDDCIVMCLQNPLSVAPYPRSCKAHPAILKDGPVKIKFKCFEFKAEIRKVKGVGVLNLTPGENKSSIKRDQVNQRGC